MSNYTLGTLNSTPVTRNGYSVTPTESTDVFKFNVGSTSNINLSLTKISAADDADLKLYRDSNGNGLFDSNDQLVSSSVRGSNRDDAINVEANAGTYFAQVSRYASGSSGNVNYNLALSATSTNSPSNLLPKENLVGDLSSDRTFTGRIDNNNTADTYSFSLGLYEGVNINLTGLSADADIRLVQDRNNNGIVDSGEVIGSSTRSGSLSESIPGINDSGNYLLEVSRFSGNTNYTLTFDHYTTTFA